MIGTPNGWTVATLGEVADWGSGGTPKATNPAFYGGPIPWAVIGDLNDGVVSGTKSSITEEALAQSSAKLVKAGTLLVAMYGSIGKLGITGRPMATNQAIAFAVPKSGVVDTKYVYWWLRSQRSALFLAGKGATQLNISQQILRAWPIAFPSLADQSRIVAAIEEQVSRIDAASQLLAVARRRIAPLVNTLLRKAIPLPPPTHWRLVTVADAGTVTLGRQRAPRYHQGVNMKRYLRVANVFEDRIDTADVMEMHFEPEEFERFKLVAGDILLNEGQSPELLGRPAMYRGRPTDVAFTNSLLRFKAGPEVDSEWALLVFRRHLHAGRFAAESRITTNIAHLSAGRFSTVEFPLPPILEQVERASVVRAQLSEAEAVNRAIAAAAKKAERLRAALLSAAFTGRLPNAPYLRQAVDVNVESIAEVSA